MVQSRYLQAKIRNYTASVEPGFEIRGTLNLRKNPRNWKCWDFVKLAASIANAHIQS
jgi:hypothetical protein